MAQQSRHSLRKRVAALFDDDAPRTRIAAALNAALAGLIIVNVATVILESVESIHARSPAAFAAIEHVATVVFAIEYALRIWTAVDLRCGAYRAPFTGRLRYMLGFFAIVDLVSVLPAALGLIGAGDLRVLRLLRLLRMLKLTRHSQVFGLLWAVLREEAQTIGALLFVLCLTLTVSGALMYMIEEETQPSVFSSIPASMWWAIETLTTVGYGDMVPETVAGKMLGGFVSITGIGTLALFSGVITVGFLDQLKLRHERSAGRVKAAAPPQGAEICPCCGRRVDRQPGAPALRRGIETTSPY
jgi:voltage-gated potassium channel